jgi:aldehyde dehydrogenase (NAD+)
MAHEAVTQGAGLSVSELSGGSLQVTSPIDGGALGRVAVTETAAVDSLGATAAEAFKAWRLVPAPRRGEFVRLLGNELRARKEVLAALVSDGT